ncbi:hypothetical protein [Mesorhizobium sp. LjNodule214]|uniref:hypothetical protein n=1 Tax=Mesorhizobium sp. LjNodule214 TaxID=3342252 RepID=UPI003ED03A00
MAYFETALALCSYFQGDYPEAVAWIKRTTVPSNAIYHSIAAAVFAEAGYVADADRERSWLKANAPVLTQNLRREAFERFAQPEDAEVFLASLRKAGLDVQD